MAARYGRSLPQLAIAWVLGHPAVSVALVGMRNDRELAENAAATEWRLSAEDRAEIDRIFAEENCPDLRGPPADPAVLTPVLSSGHRTAACRLDGNLVLAQAAWPDSQPWRRLHVSVEIGAVAGRPGQRRVDGRPRAGA